MKLLCPQLTRDLFAIAKFLFRSLHTNYTIPNFGTTSYHSLIIINTSWLGSDCTTRRCWVRN